MSPFLLAFQRVSSLLETPFWSPWDGSCHWSSQPVGIWDHRHTVSARLTNPDSKWWLYGWRNRSKLMSWCWNMFYKSTSWMKTFRRSQTCCEVPNDGLVCLIVGFGHVWLKHEHYLRPRGWFWETCLSFAWLVKILPGALLVRYLLAPKFQMTFQADTTTTITARNPARKYMQFIYYDILWLILASVRNCLFDLLQEDILHFLKELATL